MAQAHILRLVRVRAAVASGEARRLREAARLSLAEVASACGADQSTIWRWEQGKRVPRGELALAYGELLDELRDTPSGASENSGSAARGAASDDTNDDGAEESCQAASTPSNESPLTSAN